jgi:competence ComEA-like helix-hairpin-helix protein
MKLVAVFALACAAAALAADSDAEKLPPGQGREVVAKVCVNCHGADNFRKNRLNKDEWSDKVSDMVDQGAQAGPEDVTVIVDYLVRNFGTDSKVYVNTAPLAELKVVLGFTNDEARAVIAWREEKGDLHSADELLRVPGLDAQKVAAKRDLMAF